MPGRPGCVPMSRSMKAVPPAADGSPRQSELNSPRSAELNPLTGGPDREAGGVREGSGVMSGTISLLDDSSDEESTSGSGCSVRRCVVRVCMALFCCGLALVALHFLANYALRQAVIAGTSYLFGYRADLDSADVAFTTGRTRLFGLSVENPPNFTDNFLEIREGLIDAKLHTVIANPLWVNDFVIEGVVLTIQQQGLSSNVQIIIDSFENITGFPWWLEDVTMVIEHLRISDITVRCSGFVDTTVPIDNIVINDIGKPDGVGLKEVVGVAIKRLVNHAMAQGPKQLRQAFHDGVWQVKHRIEHAAHVIERPFIRAAHTLTNAVGLHEQR